MRVLIVLALCLPLWAKAGCSTWASNPCTAKPAAVTAKSYIVLDMDGNVLKEQNADEVRSIASITKLVTVTKASMSSGEEYIVIQPEDMKLGKMRSTPLKVGQAYTRAQLTELALVSSDNVAAMALGRTVPKDIGADLPSHTTIVEASGLNPENKSTAREVAEIARKLYNTDIAATSVQPTASLGNRRSTNPLIGKPGWTFYLSKTGFINDAGGCLVVITQAGDRLLMFVILGSQDTKQRWRDLYELRKEFDDSQFSAPEWVKKVIKKFKRKKT